MLRFLVDECCEPAVVELLRAEGHDVRYVADDAAGASDQYVIDQAIAERRILVTDDKDFGEFVVRRGHFVAGVLLIRIDPADRTRRLARIAELLRQHGWRLSGHYVVLNSQKSRFRPVPAR